MAQIITSEYLTKLINTAYQATELSVAGKMWVNKELGQVNKIALDTFLTVLSSILPRSVDSNIIVKEPKEPWQE